LQSGGVDLDQLPIAPDHLNAVRPGLKDRAQPPLAGVKRRRLRRKLGVPLFELPNQRLAVLLHHIQFLDGIRLRRSAAPLSHELLDRLGNLPGGRGFPQETIRAKSQRECFVGAVHVGAGVKDKGKGCAPLAAPHLRAKRVAIHVRHQNVGNHGVNRLGLQDAERFQSVARFEGVVTFGGERDAEQLPVGGIVVHDEDVHRGRGNYGNHASV
jgi:hypothetical protein